MFRATRCSVHIELSSKRLQPDLASRSSMATPTDTQLLSCSLAATARHAGLRGEGARVRAWHLPRSSGCAIAALGIPGPFLGEALDGGLAGQRQALCEERVEILTQPTVPSFASQPLDLAAASAAVRSHSERRFPGMSSGG